MTTYERYLVNEQRLFFSNVRTSFDVHDKIPCSIAMVAKSSSSFCLFILGDCVYLLSLDGWCVWLPWPCDAYTHHILLMLNKIRLLLLCSTLLYAMLCFDTIQHCCCCSALRTLWTTLFMFSPTWWLSERMSEKALCTCVCMWLCASMPFTLNSLIRLSLRL